MLVQSKKVLPWSKKNYVATILHFLLHAAVLSLLVVGFIATDYAEQGGIERFFSETMKLTNYVYTVIFIFLICFSIYVYLFAEFRDFLMKGKNIALIFVISEICLIIYLAMGKYLNVYARPAALFALLILLLINKRCALFLNFIFCLLLFIIDIFLNASLGEDEATAELVINACSSVLAIYLVDGIGSRIKVFFMGFIVAVPIVICSALSFLISTETFSAPSILLVSLYGLIGGVTSVVIMMAVLPIFEWAFNMLTDYRLSEITDHKSKLIKKMIENAGGTFNHSTVVAQLAENCATAIGENSLLARACAYYHDIGKLKQPIYFTENQHGYNPHDDLTPELSTEIIRSHAQDGYNLIKKYHLPQILADVALEHHGTLPIQYFYAKAQKFTDGEVDIADYCYHGPKPSSKIAAVIMIADGCEAAVRAQADRSRDKVEKIVRSIIDDRMRKEQFSDCEITMRDLDIIEDALVNSLSGVYHDRIKYPKMNSQHVNAFNSGKKN
ncbi:MAG: HDIG domain-containing protein [Clostridia bacterium]|nr:HDIG domain-containing protein [Clostridia bacterium]